MTWTDQELEQVARALAEPDPAEVHDYGSVDAAITGTLRRRVRRRRGITAALGILLAAVLAPWGPDDDLPRRLADERPQTVYAALRLSGTTGPSALPLEGRVVQLLDQEAVLRVGASLRVREPVAGPVVIEVSLADPQTMVFRAHFSGSVGRWTAEEAEVQAFVVSRPVDLRVTATSADDQLLWDQTHRLEPR